MADVLPPDAGAGETPPAPVANAGGAAPGVTPTITDEGSPGVDPLLGRLKAAGIQDNDLEQVRRYYGGFDETRGLKGRVGELEGQDSLRDYADQLMESANPSLQEEHTAWRATYGDAAYVEGILRQRSRTTGEAPEESDDERIARIVKEQVATATAPLREERRREAAAKALDQDLTGILGSMKLPEKVQKFLRKDIERNIGAYSQANPKGQLADLVQERHQALSELLTSNTKTTPAPPTPVVPEEPPTSVEGKSNAGFSDKGEPLSIDEIVDAAAEQAGNMEVAAGPN